MVCFLEGATFSSLSIRPSTEAVPRSKATNIVFSLGTNYKVGLNKIVIKTSGLKWGVEFLVRS